MCNLIDIADPNMSIVDHAHYLVTIRYHILLETSIRVVTIQGTGTGPGAVASVKHTTTSALRIINPATTNVGSVIHEAFAGAQVSSGIIAVVGAGANLIIFWQCSITTRSCKTCEATLNTVIRGQSAQMHQSRFAADIANIPVRLFRPLPPHLVVVRQLLGEVFLVEFMTDYATGITSVSAHLYLIKFEARLLKNPLESTTDGAST
ncbi:hypothetical protein BDY19DRAFT_910772 [Irpex rosettiformis]|uniref:Uncharacterized protein n=1 Tax=Irpex rosettiformis TaxID=378272 RepID=A0ACB8TMI6_9APHY|nr:hypothetical protein BDY19DRAFT_910772 [Irpex rosettiformis]